MVYDLGIQISKIHDKLKFAKDKQLAPLVNILPKWLLPNHITALRSLILLIWFPFAINYPRLSQIAVFILIYFLDLLDGAMARLKDRETYFGEYFDHISDKFNTIALLFLLYGLTHYQFAIFKIFIGWDTITSGLLAIEFILKLRKREISYAKEPLDIVMKISLWIFIIFRIAPIIL